MKQFQPDATPNDRLRLLQENAAHIEATSYQKPLTADELADRREALADNCIKLNAKEDELNEIKKSFKPEMDGLKSTNKKLLSEIKTKQQTVEGNLFQLADYDSGMMETFDSDGFLISSRRLRPEEKQGNVFQLGKTN